MRPIRGSHERQRTKFKWKEIARSPAGAKPKHLRRSGAVAAAAPKA